jgi:hypothetical protein
MNEARAALQHLAGLPMAVLMPLGRPGSAFLHGLLDGHPQVSLLPFPAPLAAWFGRNQPPQDLSAAFALFAASAREACGPYGLAFDENRMRTIFLDALRDRDAAPRARTLRELLLAFHVAWSLGNRAPAGAADDVTRPLVTDVLQARVVFWNPHDHAPWYRDLLEEAPSWKLLFAVRDPRESLVSTYAHWVKSRFYEIAPATVTGYLRHEHIVRNLTTILAHYRFFCAHRDRALALRAEDLNDDPEKTTAELARFFGIDVRPELRVSTLGGRSLAEASTRGLSGFGKERNQTRWQQELPPEVVAILEELHWESMNEFGYARTTLRDARDYRANALRPLALALDAGLYARAFKNSAINARTRTAQTGRAKGARVEVETALRTLRY